MSTPIIKDHYEKFARQLDWNLLRTFLAIVQYRGVSRAAERLHLTQPAVSQALKRLEAQFDCTVVERNTRKFEITDAGAKLYAKALEIHAQVSRLKEVATTETETIQGHV